MIGLHTVFEHHGAQGTQEALAAFVHEYGFAFPIRIDRQAGRLPTTMSAYAMQGTPTLVVIDRAGYRRFQHFGHVDDLSVGRILESLVAEPVTMEAGTAAPPGCGEGGCAIPATA